MSGTHIPRQNDPYRSNLPGQQPMIEKRPKFHWSSLLWLLCLIPLYGIFKAYQCDVERAQHYDQIVTKRKQYAQTACGDNRMVERVDYDNTTKQLNIICVDIPKKELKTIPWEN